MAKKNILSKFDLVFIICFSSPHKDVTRTPVEFIKMLVLAHDLIDKQEDLLLQFVMFEKLHDNVNQ